MSWKKLSEQAFFNSYEISISYGNNIIIYCYSKARIQLSLFSQQALFLRSVEDKQLWIFYPIGTELHALQNTTPCVFNILFPLNNYFLSVSYVLFQATIREIKHLKSFTRVFTKTVSCFQLYYCSRNIA